MRTLEAGLGAAVSLKAFWGEMATRSLSDKAATEANMRQRDFANALTLDRAAGNPSGGSAEAAHQPRREPIDSAPPPDLKGRLLAGAVAQMGERCNRTAEVRGSNPLSSTTAK